MREGEKVKFPGMKRMWRIFTKEELEVIDNAAYNILSEMGVHIDDKECIEYLKDTPVEIDEKELIVKFPEYWVREMIARAPRTYLLAGRDPKRDLHVTSLQRDFYALITSGSTKYYEWDDNANKWISKIPGEEEVIKAFKMVDGLDQYEGFFGTLLEDVKKTQQGLPAELHTLYNKMKYSTKFGGPTAITEGGLAEWDYVGKLAAEVQGGFDELTKRPIIAGLPTCIGPLTSTRQNFWAAVGSAKYHLPTFPYWGGISPFTAPATALGQVVLAVACCHYAMAVSQYLDPGTATCPWPMCTSTDPNTGQLAGIPSARYVHAMGMQLYQDLYNLVVSQCSYCLTTSLDEAATAWLSSVSINTLLGGNIVQFGTTPQAFIFETIPIGATLLDLVRGSLFAQNEFISRFDDEHLALDVIKEVGPKGKFTTHPHTLKWIDPAKGLYWRAKDWIHEHSDQWLAKGAKSWVYDTCRQRLKELEKHEPEPIAKDVDERCTALLKQADEELALF